MKSHLVIKVNGQEMALQPDQSIDFEERNPLFDDVDMFSLPFEVPFAQNRHILKNMDDPDSDARAIDIEHLPVEIIAEGLPMRNGARTAGCSAPLRLPGKHRR